MRTIDELTSKMDTLPKQIQNAQRQQRLNAEEIKRLRDLLDFDDADLFDATMNTKLIDARLRGDSDANRHRTHRYSSGVTSLWHYERARVKQKRIELQATIHDLEASCRSAAEQVKTLETEQSGLPNRIGAVADQLRDIRNAKDRIYRIAKGTGHEPSTTAPARSPQPRQQASSEGKPVMTAEDLRNTSFETFELPTELGRFLGQLDRNKTAIALTGDSGAGKSYFAFELTRLFSDEGYRTKYYCLEEGFGALTQQKIHKYDISPEVEFADQATIADVRRDAFKYDLIVIDSFNKLNTVADDFERLRSDFPRTIFIIIFQKTTSGAIRGGSSILFNSSATIDIVREGDARVAHMVKGRYGTQGWRYDISLFKASPPDGR